MTQLEQQVADELRRRAAAMDVPVPHVVQLVDDGEAVLTRRRRRVGLLATAAAAAVVGVVALGPALLGSRDDVNGPAKPSPSQSTSTPDGAARTLDDLPQGDPPAAPYLSHGVLHVDGRAIDTSANRVIAGGTTVLVGRSGEQDAQWWLLEGDQLVPVPQLDGVFAPMISPTGDLLVWTSYPDLQTTRVTAWNPATRREVDHVDLDAPYAECCGGGQEVELYGIDAQGTAYFTKSSGLMTWRPQTGTPRRLVGARAVTQIAPTGPMVQSDGPGQLGVVDEQGRWSKVADLPTDQAATWSSDGALMAYAGDDEGSVLVKQSPTDEWVLDVTSGDKTRLDLPEGAQTSAIVFESAQHLLVDAFTNPREHYVLRCDTTDGRCERTLPPGRVSGWTFATPF